MIQDPNATGSSADVTAEHSVADGDALPSRVGPYRVDRLLGRGGMGEVYRGFDPRLQRPVAIKRILAARQGPAARARFWREARALAALRDPAFVTIHDIGESDGALYLAMELVDGTPLSAAPRRPWPADAAAALIHALARALGVAHGAGIVHRDVKPSNVLVTADGSPRLIDFGLARRDGDAEVTRSGAMVGTLSWMAPEQISGEPTGPAADVFALGSLLYTLLSGEHPFSRDSNDATAAAILVTAHAPLGARRPDLSPELHALVDRCLERAPGRRPADGRALARELEAIAERSGWALDTAAVAAVVAGVAEAGPAQATGIAGASRRRPRRRAVVAALAAGVVAVTLTLAASGGDGPLADDLASAPSAPPAAVGAPEAAPAVVSPQAQRPDVAPAAPEAAIALLRDTRRRVLAVIGAGADGDDATSLLADAVGVYLGFAPETIAAVPLRELLARAPGGELDALGPAALVTAPGAPGRIDAVGVLTVTRDRASWTVSLSWRLPGSDTPLTTLEARAPDADPLAAARALAHKTFALLDAPDAPPRIPPLTRSITAWKRWLDARRALHADRWRELEDDVRESLAADPGFTPVMLLDAVLDVDRSRPADALATLEAIAARADATTPRDASFAEVLRAELTPSERLAVIPKLEAHLERFPRDLTARLELLGLRFRMNNVGSLHRAAGYADEILSQAPATPAAASKLARSLCWTGRCDRAHERFDELGLSPDLPGFAQVFGEIALYEGRYDDALSAFARSRDDTGAITFYAAHMSLAATMLRGDCERAVADGRQMLALARSSGDTLGIDWTYYLWFNALLCAGDPANARRALDEWAERTGTTTAAQGYAAYRWRVSLAMGVPRDEVLPEVARAAADPNHAGHAEALRLLALIGGDPGELRAIAAELTRRLGADFEPGALRPGAVDRARRGLLARADLLEGHEDRAIAAFAELARADGWPVATEGNLFERVRWAQCHATALDEAGRPDDAAAAWRAILDLGYERLLTMEVTLAAKRRLGLAEE